MTDLVLLGLVGERLQAGRGESVSDLMSRDIVYKYFMLALALMFDRGSGVVT